MPVFDVFSLLALGFSLVSLIVAIVGTLLLRREPPDVAELKSRVLAIDQEVTDVNDRLQQWMRRESVRKMREGKEQKQLEESLQGGQDGGSLQERKAAIRARARAARLGVAS